MAYIALYDNPQALVVYTQQSAITIIWIQRVKNMMGVSAPQSQEELVTHGSWRPIQFHKKTQRFRFSHIFLRCDLDHPTNFQNPPIRAFRDNIILLFSNGVDFHPALHFQEVFGGFWEISLKWSLYVENWKKSFLRPLFRATFPLNTDLHSSSGSQRVPEDEFELEFNGEVARNNGPSNFSVELRL